MGQAAVPGTEISVVGRRLGVIAIVLVGFGIRMLWLDGQSLWLDELIQVYLSDSPLLILPATLAEGAQMPADVLITKAVSLLSTADFALRFPTVLAGTMAIALIVPLTRRLMGSGQMWAAWLLAFMPLAVAYSREVRPYSQLLLYTLLATLIYIKTSQGRNWWILYALATLWGLHIHLFGISLVLVHGVHWILATFRGLWRNRSWPDLAAAILGFGTPLILYSLSPFRPDYLFRFAQMLLVGLASQNPNVSLDLPQVAYGFQGFDYIVPKIPYHLIALFPWGILTVFLILLGASGLARRPWELSLLLMWLVIPPLLIIYTLYFRDQFYHQRYLIVSLPPGIILLVSGIQRVVHRLSSPRRNWHILVVGMTLLALLSPALRRALVPNWGEDWRGLAAHLSSAPNQESYLAIPNVARYLRHYLPQRYLAETADWTTIARSSQGHDKAFIILSPYSPLSTASLPGLRKIPLTEAFGDRLQLWQFDPEDPLKAANQKAALPAQLRHPQSDEDIRELLALAKLARRRQDWDSAVAALDSFLSVDPGHADMWNELGFAYRQRGNLASAQHAYTEALRIEPNNPWSHILAAHLLIDLGKLSESMAHAEAAVELAPENPQTWGAYGRILLVKGMAGDAIHAYETGLALAPTDLDLMYGLARATAERRPWQAAAIWHRLLDQSPPPNLAREACRAIGFDEHSQCQQVTP